MMRHGGPSETSVKHPPKRSRRKRRRCEAKGKRSGRKLQGSPRDSRERAPLGYSVGAGGVEAHWKQCESTVEALRKRRGSTGEPLRMRSHKLGSAPEAPWNHHGSPTEALPKSWKRPPGGVKTCVLSGSERLHLLLL